MMIDYKTTAKPRIVTDDDIAVFCSYDEILPIGQLQAESTESKSA